MSDFARLPNLFRFLLTPLLVIPLVAGTGSAVALAEDSPTSVIVQKLPGAGSAPEELVGRLGGKVTYDLSIINGFAAHLDASQVSILKAFPGVRHVSDDAPVYMNEVIPADDALSDVTQPEDAVPTLTAPVDSDDNATVVADTSVRSTSVDALIPDAATTSTAPAPDAPSDVSVYQKEINATDAHNAGATGAGVTVALIDTGISPVGDLAGKTVKVKAPNGFDKSCVNLSGEAGCGDSYGHGTFIAGLIAGSGAASGGKYAGVAPDAKILSVKIAGRDGSASVGKIIFAIQWVKTHRNQYGIDVMNLSLGTDSTQSYKVDPLNYAVEQAWNSGINVVVSAGNRGPGAKTISKPGDDPLVITTGAVDDVKTPSLNDDFLPDFSSKGPTAADGITKPDLVAPGAHLISLRAPNSAVETEFPGGGVDSTYRRGSGTSQSAGVVSGAIALLLQKHPDLTPNQVKYALKHSTNEVASNNPNAVGAGMLDIGAAIKNLPVGSDNAGVVLGNGSGSIANSQGRIRIVLEEGTDVKGLAGGVIPVKGSDNADPSGGSWYGTSWYGGSWYGGSWYGGSWYGQPAGGSWYGGSWYGGSWYGGSWYGGSWYGGSWYGGSWYGGSWYGVWN